MTLGTGRYGIIGGYTRIGAVRYISFAFGMAHGVRTVTIQGLTGSLEDTSGQALCGKVYSIFS